MFTIDAYLYLVFRFLVEFSQYDIVYTKLFIPPILAPRHHYHGESFELLLVLQ